MSTFLHYVHCKDALLDCSAPGGERYESLTWVDEIGTRSHHRSPHFPFVRESIRNAALWDLYCFVVRLNKLLINQIAYEFSFTDIEWASKKRFQQSSEAMGIPIQAWMTNNIALFYATWLLIHIQISVIIPSISFSNSGPRANMTVHPRVS